ncbi:hypothetical protein AKO1_003501 [Acrasis kona]|uniref:Uncharacterized protein n=1 Tax=Acrasis kona TaxID=1008807 RepID=A0AAW2YH97_9EUKA
MENNNLDIFNHNHTRISNLETRLHRVELQLSNTTIILAIGQIMYILKTACEKAYYFLNQGVFPRDVKFLRPSKIQAIQALSPYSHNFDVQAFWSTYDEFNHDYRADIAHTNLPVIQSITVPEFRSALERNTTSEQAQNVVDKAANPGFIGEVDSVMRYVEEFKKECNNMASRQDTEDHWARIILGSVERS